MTLQEVIEKARELTIDERKQLVMSILDSLTEEQPKRKRSILEFEGLGEYDGVDAQEYVNELRKEWDDRP